MINITVSFGKKVYLSFCQTHDAVAVVVCIKLQLCLSRLLQISRLDQTDNVYDRPWLANIVCECFTENYRSIGSINPFGRNPVCVSQNILDTTLTIDEAEPSWLEPYLQLKISWLGLAWLVNFFF